MVQIFGGRVKKHKIGKNNHKTSLKHIRIMELGKELDYT